MDDNITTIEGSEIEEAFIEVPEEVQNFMMSKAFDVIIDAIKNTLGLTEEQRRSVYFGAQELLLGTKTNDEIAQLFLDAGMSPEVAAKAFYAVHTEILTRAENINEYFFDEDKESSTEPTSAISAPSPADVLASLKERMTSPTTIAPIVRQTPVIGISAIIPPQADISSAPKIDPYRELPPQ